MKSTDILTNSTDILTNSTDIFILSARVRRPLGTPETGMETRALSPRGNC